MEYSYLLVDQVILFQFSTGIIFSFFGIIFLLIVSGLISASEVAFFSLTHNDFAQLREENSKSAQRTLILQERPRSLLATILISNNFINVAIVVLSAYLFNLLLSKTLLNHWAESISRAFPSLLQGNEFQIAKGLDFLFTTLVATSLLVLFGEVVPKIYAKLNNVSLAKNMSGILLVLMKILTPFNLLLVRGTNVIEAKLETNANNTNAASREDIGEAIDLSVGQEKDNEQEIDILKGIVKFGDVSAKQIMRPRVDVKSLEASINYHELLEIAKESGFSRLPVYEEDFDHLLGILYVKDLLPHLSQGSEFKWQKLIRNNTMYVPESKKIDDLLRDFQSKRTHMAIVVDEYGGSSGIVTLEDIMEEVIGEIRDEFDDEEEVDYQQINEYTYQFEGKTLINDAFRIMNQEVSDIENIKGDADSVAGLILELSGIIPKKGAEFFHNGYKFKVILVNPRRIQQVLISLPQ